jgi:hypothetical protein
MATKKTTKKVSTTKKVVNSVKKVLSQPATVWNGPDLIRTYTKEVHGDDYQALAQQIADKKGWEVK